MAQGYLAARYSRRLELCGYRTELEKRGHAVPARWLLGEHQVHGLEAAQSIESGGPIPAEKAVLFANDDVEDVLNSQFMIAFSEAPRSDATRGGRHVELGIFLGLKFALSANMERKLYVVGPLENIFMCVPEVDGLFNSFDSFLAALDSGEVKL